MISQDDIDNRFDYHRPKDDATVERHELVRDLSRHWALTLNVLIPDGREKSLAITKIEEAMFWANAAIARNND